jgi:hypothetical protein
MNPIAIIHILAALLMIGLSLPLVKRKIKRNSWYGVRIPESFKSEERWLEINEYGGRLLIRLGMVFAITACAGLALPKKYWVIYALGASVVILAGMGIVTARIFRYAAKTKRG